MTAEAGRAELRRGLRLPLAAAGAWLVFAYLVAPFLIAALYRGTLGPSHPELAEELARARAAASLEQHLADWRWFAIWPAVAALAWCLLAVSLADPRRVARHVHGATATSLAGLRIAVCGTALFVTLREHLPSVAWLPPEMADDMGAMDLVRAVPGFDALLASAGGLAALQVATALLLVAALAGWRTRATLPLATAGYFLLAGILRTYSRLFHAGLVPLYLLAVLCLTPAGDALSLDRRRRRRAGQALADPEEARPEYGWARYAVWTVLALVYLEAGLSKLRDGGFLWWHPVNLRTIAYRDSLAPMGFDFDLGLAAAAAPDAFFALLGLAALATELAYPAVLGSAAARRLLPAATAALHGGILLVQNVDFLDLVLLQALFYDWRRLLGRRAVVAPPDPPPGAAPRTAGRGPRRVRRLAAVLLVAWALRLELYPLSAMQMYADRDTAGEVEYLRVLARRASGRWTVAPLEEAIPALADSRYRWTLDDLFEGDAGERRTARAYLAAVARAYNRDVPGEERIVAFDVRKYRWRFLEPGPPPGDTPGELVGRVRVPAGDAR